MHPDPEPLAGSRAALIIATSTYDDPAFSRLRAPAHDAADAAQVLGDPRIGGFTVTPLIDKPEPQVRRAIGAFLTNRDVDDLVLIYLSCHGVLDRRGRLFFAVSDTLKSQLGATAVESAWLLDQLDDCRARRQVLILDCCFSGSFAEASKGEIDLQEQLVGHGRGRTVLTASRAREYSFEGESLSDSLINGSIFTAGLIEGLRTGAADKDGDGYISLDEAYSYAYDYVQAHRTDQTPQRWLYGGEGTILLARNPERSTSISSVEGAVTLAVRHDPTQQAYRFEFRVDDNPGEVIVQPLIRDMNPRIERTVQELHAIAAGRSSYSTNVAREYFVNTGASLWQELLPTKLREQFWHFQPRIKQLIIFSSEEDSVPWELLYPMDPGHDTGFLVEQFPVIRSTVGFSPARTLRLRPAWFVGNPANHPLIGSDPSVRHEIGTLRQMIDPSRSDGDVISDLASLLKLIRKGDFGLLHFACFNRYDQQYGLSMELDEGRFTPTFMTGSITEQTLVDSKPLVFVNSVRSEGWARLFIKAGAGASIGTLTAVTDQAANSFAFEFYSQLLAGASLGTATMRARQAAAEGRVDDPSWLTYVVYGDSDAKIG